MRFRFLTLLVVLAIGAAGTAPASAKGPKPPSDPPAMVLTLTCHFDDLTSHDWFPGQPPTPHLDASVAFTGVGRANYTLRIDVGDVVGGAREGPTAGYWDLGFRVPASGVYPDPESEDVLYLDFEIDPGATSWGSASLKKGRRLVVSDDLEISC